MPQTMDATHPETAPTGAPRRRRRIWIVLLAAALLILLAIGLLLPRWIDPERYRPELEAAIAQATGWRAELGAIEVTIWGGLAIRISPVRLAAPDAASSLEIEAVDLKGALRPLLQGTLVIDTVLAQRPKLTLVRGPDGLWPLPLPPEPANTAAPQGGGAGSGGFGVTIGELTARGGTLRLIDRGAAPGGTLALQELNALYAPRTGRLWGQARFAAGPGKLSWQGSVTEGVQLDIESTTAQVLSDWFGPDTIRPAGTFSGRIRTRGWTAADLELRGEGLSALAGEVALPPLSLNALLRQADPDWSLDGTTTVGPLAFVGGGSLYPQLSMRWRAANEPIEQALGVLSALGPLPVELSGPGRFDAEVSLERKTEAPLQITADASFTARTLRLAPGFPTLDKVRAKLRLDPQRGLSIEPLAGQLAGGATHLVATLTPATPQGTLRASGRITAAQLEPLMRAMGAQQVFPGLGDAEFKLEWPLARGRTLDAVRGEMRLEARDVVLAAWKPLGDEPQRLERAAATLRMDQAPWRLTGVEAIGPAFVLQGGAGTLNPLAATLDLPLRLTLSTAASRQLTERVSALRHLQSQEGRIEIAGSVRGPLAAPHLTLDLERSLLSSGKQPKELLQGLLGDYLERKRQKAAPRDPSKSSAAEGDATVDQPRKKKKKKPPAPQRDPASAGPGR